MTMFSHNNTLSGIDDFTQNATESSFYLDGNSTHSHTFPSLYQNDETNGLGTPVTIAIALGSAAFVIIIVVVVVCFVRRRIKEKKSRTWVDNLTLSYIADSNADLTKDNFDEMVSLDNDNFLNSLVDGQAFSVYSSGNNTRHYTYSYF
ncbi:hypothetical protein DPMN_069511 [Dreissena polymorpha]|uniref:Uncharacterized protein n=1 Tax=Dreissena polymorpha TaxID=45954 RepID=A0A9D4BUE8_DREPO|nr:hypothetical protein DPMN_069511 [Dreissena polymorpha]